MASDAWGIEDKFQDALGGEHVTGDDTRQEILRAMGASGEQPPPSSDVRIWRPGEPLQIEGDGELQLEDGTVLRIDGKDPKRRLDELPFGYHTLQLRGHAAPVRVLATPGRCHLPDDLRTWGWAVQLYAARSRESWGIGDLADLRELAAWTGGLGGEVLMVNPLTAATPVAPLEPSPYYPSSRRFRNPIFLRIEEVPGAAEHADEIAPLAEEARGLNQSRRIDRDRVFSLKMRALELLWRHFGDDAGFAAYRREQGAALDEFAAYCVLAERHGKDWRRWPEQYRHPGREAVRRLIGDEPRVRFFAWLQWLLDRQLEEASAAVKIIHDLPIGLDVAGADAWCWQDMMATGISVGCPPDEFNCNGQDWGLAPFIPAAMRASGYRPFIETIRATLRHAGGLRIDHVMGLFRLYWIPHSLGARGGSYVRYPADELLAIVEIESARARAFVVGEDLGTVEPGTRETMAAHAMLSYRLLYFEPGAPPEYPELALSSVTTHDLATIAGLWNGAVLDHTRSAGMTPNEAGIGALRDKVARFAGVGHDAELADAIVGTYRALAQAPSRVLLASLDDALAVIEQPNMPGTTTSWPNWSLALPWTLDQLREAELPRRLAEVLKRPPAARE